MIRSSSRTIPPDNIYDEMSESPQKRSDLLEFSIREPNTYKLRLLKDLVTDPQGVVTSYLTMTEGSDEKVQQMILDRAAIARDKNLDLSLPLPTIGFDNRLLEILRLITPETIKKMALAYRTVLRTTKDVPNTVWKVKVSHHLNEIGLFLSSNWYQEAFILSNCKNCDDIVKWLVQGRIISRIESSTISDSSTDAYALQEARITYIKACLLTASLQMHILME